MAKIEYLRINHFRGIDTFEQRFCNGITCIIGRGDSGKSTILEAISLLFAQSWTIRLNDSDFFECNTDKPIIIEGTVSGIPHELITKYDNHIRGILPDGKLIDDMESDEAKESEPVLSIRLTVKKDLEPSWEVVSNNGEDPTSIKAVDRGKLNVFAVTDYTDRHFSMNKGTPLYSLYKQLKGDVVEDTGCAVLDIVRDAKKAFDETVGDSFNEVVNVVKVKAEELGIALNEMNAILDYSDIAINENKVSLHENGIPFRLKGKGSKRLLSLAIQLALTEPSGVILIDEIEQGLEPDRAQHIVNLLAKYKDRQIIITTHSSNVVVEIPCTSLYVMRSNANSLLHVKGELQGCIRRLPEAFFASKVLVCEGATEVGLCRAINAKRIAEGKISAACKGIRFADGTGNSMVEYAFGFAQMNYSTAVFCDSDVDKINHIKPRFNDNGIVVIACENAFSIEEQIFKDVSWNTVQELIPIAIQKVKQDDNKNNDEAEKSVFDSTNTYLADKMTSMDNWYATESDALRTALGKAAKNREWYKRLNYGELIGDAILAHYNELPVDCKLKQEIDSISNWIDA